MEKNVVKQSTKCVRFTSVRPNRCFFRFSVSFALKPPAKLSPNLRPSECVGLQLLLSPKSLIIGWIRMLKLKLVSFWGGHISFQSRVSEYSFLSFGSMQSVKLLLITFWIHNLPEMESEG